MESHTHAWERFTIGLLLFLFHQHLTVGDKCVPGVITYGYTSPQGDLLIRTGRELIINCTLKPNKDVHNASQIYWMLDKQKVNATSIHVINDNTAQLRILNAQKSKFIAYCKWNGTKGPLRDICRNVVYVGDPPAANLPINCTSYDFTKITCQWPSVKDGVLLASWNLTQDINPLLECSSRAHPTVKDQSLTGNFCSVRKPCILLNVTNKFGNSASWLEFDHFRNVVLSAPGKLKVDEVTGRRAKFSWDYNERHSLCATVFSRKWSKTVWIDYKLTVNQKNDREGRDSYEVNTTRKWYLLEDLMPYTEYDVEIQGRFVYEGYKNAWSQSNSLNFVTKPDVPTALPNNLVAEISLDSQERNVTLYWTGIPKDQQAGEDFDYSVNISWNNSEPMVQKTTDTYLRLTNLSRELAYTFTVQAENEIGIAKIGSYYYIKKDEVQESLALVIDDIIVNDKNSATWNYSLSWNTSDEKIYNLALYWCRGNTSNGLIQCDDSGIHFHKTVSSKDSNYTFSLPNPTPQTHSFGFVANESPRSPRILWGSCVIPTSRGPHPPTLNEPSNNGTTWVYLTWKHPKCEHKAAYTSGYNICVYYMDEKKEMANYTVKENVTAFNVTNLLPQTVYTFGISTIIPGAKSSEATTIVTTPSATEVHKTEVMIIIFPTAIFGVFLILGSYFLYKRISLRIQDATKIDLPSKLTAKYPQDALMSGDQNHNKLVEDYKLDNTVSGTFIHNKGRDHYKMPLFIKPPTNVKDPWQTSRDGSTIDRFGYSGCMTDDMSPVSSPVESNGSQGSSQDSGFDPETPTSDVDDPTFDFEDRLNKQEDWIDSPKGYSKAILLEQRPPFAKVEEQSRASNDACEIPADYSIVGTTSVPASPAVESRKNHSQALSVNSYRLPKTSIEAKQLFSAPTVLTVFEAESDRAQVDSDVGVRVVHVPELSKGDKMPADPQNIPLNSVGYAQLSFSLDQPVSSQGMSDNEQSHAVNKDGYTKVAMAVDDFQSSLSSSASSEHQQVIPTCRVGVQPLTISIPLPDSCQVNSANGYKRLNESNLVSTSSLSKDSLLNIQPGSSTTCNEKTADSEDTAKPLSCRTMTTGYVSAVNLSV